MSVAIAFNYATVTKREQRLALLARGRACLAASKHRVPAASQTQSTTDRIRILIAIAPEVISTGAASWRRPAERNSSAVHGIELG
jgi:hypothetical protein